MREAQINLCIYTIRHTMFVYSTLEAFMHHIFFSLPPPPSPPPLPSLVITGNRQRVEDCRDHPYLRPNPFLGSGMNGLRLAPSGMEPVGAGTADPRMGLNTPPEMCPGCKYIYLWWSNTSMQVCTCSLVRIVFMDVYVCPCTV